jgi:hypothetical protein
LCCKVKNTTSLKEDTEASFVFQQTVEISMSNDKALKMLDALAIELSKESLGVIVGQAAEQKQFADTILQEKTGLTPSLLDAIKKDQVFTNSIPVKSLVKLLKILGLEIEKALEAIKVTFDKLQIESQMMMMSNSNFQPSFRKGMMRGELSKDLSGIKSDESFLYQNEEALNNYTTRLTELYNTL